MYPCTYTLPFIPSSSVMLSAIWRWKSIGVANATIIPAFAFKEEGITKNRPPKESKYSHYFLKFQT
jgi:hypothetical protein